MKLRILGNKIRFRLSEPEVYAFSEVHQVQAALNINPLEKNNLRYSLNCDAAFTNSNIEFNLNELKINVPLNDVKSWAASDQVGLEYPVIVPSGEDFTILIEKDFQCLTERGEDESKLFPNPNEKHN